MSSHASPPIHDPSNAQWNCGQGRVLGQASARADSAASPPAPPCSPHLGPEKEAKQDEVRKDERDHGVLPAGRVAHGVDRVDRLEDDRLPAAVLRQQVAHAIVPRKPDLGGVLGDGRACAGVLHGHALDPSRRIPGIAGLRDTQSTRPICK